MGPSILDRQDGDTIDIDFDELYGLYDSNMTGVNLPEDNQTQSDLLANCWASGNVIEDSLEAIRSVLSSANLPPNNRNIIEKSLTTLRNAMELPPDVGVEPQLRLDDWDPAPPPPPPPAPVQHQERLEGDPPDYYAAVAGAAEEESRVREALGISCPPSWSGDSHHLPLYNENFYRDRERQRLDQADSQLSLWIEDLSPGASLEEISDPQDFLPSSAEEIQSNTFQPYDPASSSSSSQCSPSVASVDNLLDQSYLLSGGEGSEAWGQGGKQMTVTRLVPYRIKKIPQDEKGGDEKKRKERQTKDEKMAKIQNLPYTVDHIINCNMEEFTEILNNSDLNSEQLNLCRDIRKRGKNKVKQRISQVHFFRTKLLSTEIFMFPNLVCHMSSSSLRFFLQIAARNCRKRKSEQITQLEEELETVRQSKQGALDNLILARNCQDHWRSKLHSLESQVLDLMTQGKSHQYRLLIDENNSVKIVNKNS